jgi:hypothetical protein
MHSLSFTKSRCLTNTLTRFGARCRHVHGVSFQLLAYQHVNWFSNLGPSTSCRNAVFTRTMPFLKHHGGRHGDWSLKLR